MATITWNGSDGAFAAGGNWTLQAAPTSGDAAVITAGTVTASGPLPSSLIIALNASNSSSPVLILSGATLEAASQLNMSTAGANVTLRLRGTVSNAGTITGAGGSGSALLQIDDAPGGGATNFINAGLIQVTGTNLQIVTAGSNSADKFENDGVISVRSSGYAPLLAYMAANLVGAGTVALAASVTFEAAQAVGAGQAFVFERGGSTTLRIDNGALFAAAVSGFAASDAIQSVGARWDTAAYAATSASSGVLSLSLGGAVTQAIRFGGSYTINSFRLQETTPPGSSQAFTAISIGDPLFNGAYYLANNPDVAAAGVDPYQHFMFYGGLEGRSPDPLFDAAYYLSQNPDVAAAGLNPLTHFEQYGWREGRDPSLLFSIVKYQAANPDVKAVGIDPLLHYFQYGQNEGRAAFLTGGTAPADTLVSPAFYDRQLGATIIPAGLAGQQQAAWSYGASGWQRGLNPDAFFDTNYYLAQNPDVRAAGLDPLTHFEQYGWREGRDPSLLFSTAKYLTAYPDVQAAGLDPLQQYLQSGQGTGRIAFLPGITAAADPLIDATYYDRQLGATLIPTGTAAQQQAAAAYGVLGWRQGLNPDAFFDTNYYLSHNPDVAAAHIDPVKHYEQYGWREGRDPSKQFSTSKYLAAYSDVRAAGLDPLEHFLVYGQAEGRVAIAA